MAKMKEDKMSIGSVTAEHDHDRDYAALLASVRRGFESSVANGERLFATAGDPMFSLYLDGLPSHRQVHHCSACRQFVERFGGLVTIDETGSVRSAVWHPDLAPEFYRPAMAAMAKAAARRRVSSPFLARESTWGTPKTGDWTHFAVEPSKHLVFRHALLTPGQAMAAKREDFGTVARALADFTADMLAEAMRLLQAETLARSERFIGPVKWLQDLHAARSTTKNAVARDNILWRAIATAPDGFCHPRASVVGALLEDIAAGMAFDEVKRRFDAKMHPLLYQRPQAASSSANIEQAERIVAQLGIAPSLARRFARLDEVELIWRPVEKMEAPAASGVFGHLKATDRPAPTVLDIPAITVTWDKFARTVLPSAEALDLLLPHGAAAFIGVTTAASADAPPILKWDREDRRNPVAWYCYHNGSIPEQWGLRGGSWCRVTGIMPLPTLWGDDPMPHLGEGMVLVLDGARDHREDQGIALFPEFLRQELHSVRATIEAYSRSAKMQGRDEGSANGYDIRKGRQKIGRTIRVMTAGRWTRYMLDRWD